MSTKRTSSAFMTSVVIHIIIILAAGLYLLSQPQEFNRSGHSPTEQTTNTA